jgi:phage-related protein
MKKIILYQTISGNNPVADYIGKLETKAQAKIARALDLFQKYGVALGPPHVEPVPGAKGIRELRVPFGGQAYRLLFFVDGETIVLLHGFTKKSRKLPRKELQIAVARMKDYLSRR